MAHPKVLVVGAGPVGLAAANRLLRNGAAVRIIDRNPARTTLSKALAINVRTLEHLEASGLSDRLIEAGQRINRMRFFRGADPLAEIDLSRLHHRFNYLVCLPQSETERIFEDELNAQGGRVERETELTGFHREGETVTAALTGPGGWAETATVDYLVGADGAHSAVRKGLGVGFPGGRHDLRWNLADVQIDGPYRDDEAVMHLQPAHAMLVLPLGRRWFRIVTTVPDALNRLPLGRVVGQPAWNTDFTTSHRIVDSYGAGRVFLVGDAAHLHSPAGGRGMNLGIEDATVLANRIVGGGLETYSRDRRKVGLSVIAQTERMLTMVTLSNPLAQALRNLALRCLVPLEPVQARLRPRLMGLAD